MTTGTHGGFDAIEVLTRSGEERAAFAAAAGVLDDDTALVRALLGGGGGPGRDRAGVDAIVRLAAVVRALGALTERRIELEELAAGVRAHARATGDFSRFGPARPLLRTVLELVEEEGLAPARVAAQLGRLHAMLHESLCEQLTGDPTGLGSPPNPAPASTDAWREQYRIAPGATARELDAFATECLDGPPNYPGGGLAALAWVRGWRAVPVVGERHGDAAGEAERLLATLRELGSTRLLQVKRARPSRYAVRGPRVEVGEGLRRCYAFEPDARGVQQALGGDRGGCVFTTPLQEFAVLEEEDHHVLAGPVATLELLCGTSLAEAMATFRSELDEYLVDGEQPEHLSAAERRYGRLRPRSR